MALKDRRELILTRLLEIGSALPGIEIALRNSDTVPEKSRPAFLLTDGDESASDEDRAAQLQKAGIYLMVMTPQITLFADGPSQQLEDTLSTLYVSLVDAVFKDATIDSLTGKTGNIRPNGRGYTVDDFGRRQNGELRVNLEFTYPFRVGELA